MEELACHICTKAVDSEARLVFIDMMPRAEAFEYNSHTLYVESVAIIQALSDSQSSISIGWGEQSVSDCTANVEGEHPREFLSTEPEVGAR
ncbi:hypothetical protein D3C87_1219590 [compost metagenome]